MPREVGFASISRNPFWLFLQPQATFRVLNFLSDKLYIKSKIINVMGDYDQIFLHVHILNKYFTIIELYAVFDYTFHK